MGVRHEADRLRRVIVCAPDRAYFSVTDLVRYNLTERADRERAVEQHRALREVLASFGAEVVNLPELEGDPNCVFTQDTAVITPEGFVRPYLGLPSRRDEAAWMAETLKRLGEPEVGEIFPPGTLEGGDLILAGDVAFLGLSQRTNVNGMGQIAACLEQMGYEVRAAIVPEPALHAGGAMSVVGPRQVLACADLFPAKFFHGFEVIAIPQTGFVCGNVITLGEGEVIAERRNEVTIEALTSAGFTVHPLDFSEFVKGTGGPSCLVLPVARF